MMEIHQKMDAVYVFGIGSKIDMEELKIMASKVCLRRLDFMLLFLLFSPNTFAPLSRFMTLKMLLNTLFSCKD